MALVRAENEDELVFRLFLTAIHQHGGALTLTREAVEWVDALEGQWGYKTEPAPDGNSVTVRLVKVA